ncbi:MAG: hypothetical protein ACI4NM_10605 [Bullifex sp.]
MSNDVWDYLNIVVPCDAEGIYEIETNSDSFSHVYTVHLEKNDYQELNDLFDQFNRMFGIIIDFFEDEIIENKNLMKAIKLTKEYMLQKPSSKISGMKLLSALEKGIQTGNFVMFCF